MTFRTRGRVQPSGPAKRLAREMAGNDRVMREILDETITSAEQGRLLESGRTMCAGTEEIDAPVARFPRAVDLARCPVGLSGVWHTHVTESQFDNPTNSLPDMANVILSDVDVHFAVGTQTAEAVIAPRDPSAGREAFQNALGADVNTVEEVVSALQAARIGNPQAARDRARKALGPLVVRYDTGYDDLNARADAYFSRQQRQQQPVRAAAPTETTSTDAGKLRERSRNAGQILAELERRLNLKGEATSSAVGIVVGSAISRLLGLD